MKFLTNIQDCLEDKYGAHTGLNVLDFVRIASSVPGLGTLLVEQALEAQDLNLAVLLDRDLLAAWESTQTPRSVSVPFEEVSHFVYLSFNHNRGRNVTQLEMEMQSEVDRVLLAFDPRLQIGTSTQKELLDELFQSEYPNADYEFARKSAASFVRGLAGGNPSGWTPQEFKKLRDFFHSDLSEKIRLSKHE